MRITDPNFPIIFDRTTDELQENLLFCVVVAGKKASIQIKLLHAFLNSWDSQSSPFQKIQEMDEAGVLAQKLQDARIGQYTRLICCFRSLINKQLDLNTCTVEDLESIHGIGPKTARFFMTCNRPNVRHCVIDTHLLKFMSQHLNISVPATTPSSKNEYTRLENIWLEYVDSLGVNPAELDLAVWKMYANRDDTEYKNLISSKQMVSSVS